MCVRLCVSFCGYGSGSVCFCISFMPLDPTWCASLVDIMPHSVFVSVFVHMCLCVVGPLCLCVALLRCAACVPMYCMCVASLLDIMPHSVPPFPRLEPALCTLFAHRPSNFATFGAASMGWEPGLRMQGISVLCRKPVSTLTQMSGCATTVKVKCITQDRGQDREQDKKKKIMAGIVKHTSNHISSYAWLSVPCWLTVPINEEVRWYDTQ